MLSLPGVIKFDSSWCRQVCLHLVRSQTLIVNLALSGGLTWLVYKHTTLGGNSDLHKRWRTASEVALSGEQLRKKNMHSTQLPN